MLSDNELARYDRQLMLPEFDVAGQLALKRAHVAVVGLGGLGCPAALLLARAGVGQLTLIDGDDVALSNLPRQLAHNTSDCGRNKAHSVAESIAAANPKVEVHIRPSFISATTAAADIRSADVVVDATDNPEARYVLNRACIAAGVPLVFGAAIAMEGQVSVFDPASGGPCYRCLYPQLREQQANCANSGVLGPAVSMVGSLQAMEVIKLITKSGESLRGKLLLMDFNTLQFHTIVIPVNPVCEDCVTNC